MQVMKFFVSALTKAFSVRVLSFNGTIPTEIGNARNLSYVRLFDNDLVGEIPSELGELSQLNEFWVSENGLNGRIPSELGLISDMGKRRRLLFCA
jgi:Leucine-rich repeat (LRR) protein